MNDSERITIEADFADSQTHITEWNLSQFLSLLPLNEQGRSNGVFMQQIKVERDSWGES